MSALTRRGFLAAAAASAAAGADECGQAEAPRRAARSASRPAAGPATDVIREPARDVPVAGRFDLCVVGGSCTGVFAAIAGARLGASVCVVENEGFFGGTATASLVNIWHSLKDTEGKRKIIGGLTEEMLDRLKRRRAVRDRGRGGFALNPAEMVLELDEMLAEAKVRPMLHTRFVAPVGKGGRLDAVIVEDKTARRAIRAGQFIDATGDGDLIHRMGLLTYKDDVVQPPTTCAILLGLDEIGRRNKGFRLGRAVFDPKHAEALKPGFLWSARVPGLPDATMVAGTRVHGADCSDAGELTAAEIEGRRQVRAMCDILRKHYDGEEALGLAVLPGRIGIRESRHARCLHTLTQKEVLTGKRFDDAIANGSYPVDVHHADSDGLTFRYLDGREAFVSPTTGRKSGRWREATPTNPTFYQVPYRSLVPTGSSNVLAAGRVIDADRGAFGAVRVMVNCNQTGQAAGVAAALALGAGCGVADVDAAKLRKALQRQGAVII